MITHKRVEIFYSVCINTLIFFFVIAIIGNSNLLYDEEQQEDMNSP